VLALERLARFLARTDRPGSRVAVCYLDLDGFRSVNDELGSVQGDALLVEAGLRICRALRATDTVARLGGDEFMLVLDLDLDDAAAAVQATLQQVLERLAQPFMLDARPSHVTASAGAALYPDHGVTPEHLVRAAFDAMYRAKRLGRGRLCMAGGGSERPAAQEALLEDLRTALATDQLVLHYQPKVCAHTRRPQGAEALVRWQHPRQGLLPPGAFLPAVAGTPLETTLDLWVLRTAVGQWVRWRAAGRGLHVAINVSAATLALPDLADTIAGMVRAAAPGQAIPLGGLELEVLETAALSDLDAARRGIEACAAHGLSFALDDFGTGYSSLSYLQRLPVTTLKIDRSFVSNMLANRGDLHIVRAVIGLAQSFGVGTVAEGVETAEQARMLAELGCQQLQGYGIARPMPVRMLEAWLDSCAESDGVSAAVHQRPGNDPIGGNP
jgi:diguanylate cyclase (GGDEF)-like protein